MPRLRSTAMATAWTEGPEKMHCHQNRWIPTPETASSLTSFTSSSVTTTGFLQPHQNPKDTQPPPASTSSFSHLETMAHYYNLALYTLGSPYISLSF